MSEFFHYFISAKSEIFALLLEHIQLTIFAVGIAILIGVPIGILISYVKGLNKPVLGFANIMQAIPSMALLGFCIPFLGIGDTPAIFMVVLYSLLPIIKNTYTGIEGINPQTLEAATGIGMTPWQILFQVQIPLALPIIMAGVRISAVTAVGLMTMASFIGAGGLGTLIWAGIRTVNNYQILAGAIPACFLALFIDFLAGIVEKLATPISLKADIKDKKTALKQRNLQKTILATTVIVLCGLFGYTAIIGQQKAEDTITIGSKNFTEQIVVSNMIAELIENRTDIHVNRALSLGSTQVCFSALTSGEIDLYVDYTGTSYGTILKYPPSQDKELIYNTVKKDYKEKYNIEVLKDLNFNNTYTLAIKPELAEKYNIKTISDLAKISNRLIISPTIEFANREDGMLGINQTYPNLKFKQIIPIDDSPRYIALKNGESDVIDAFSTDGLLKSFNLVVLEDDQNFFLPYYAIPQIRGEVLEKYPELELLLEELGNVLSDEIMRDLNYQVDDLQKDPRDVAVEFLKQNNLI